MLTEQQERLQQFPALSAAAAEAASARDVLFLFRFPLSNQKFKNWCFFILQALRVAEERWAQQGAPALEELDALRARHLETDREIGTFQ